MAEYVCAIHNAPEPDLPGDYHACGECLHVWRTRENYVADVQKMERELNWPTLEPILKVDPDTLEFCPLCTHDW